MTTAKFRRRGTPIAFPPRTADQITQSDRLIQDWYRHERWQGWGWTLICTGTGGLLGHLGCMIQGLAVLAFGSGMGAWSIPTTLVTIPIAHITLNRVRPPKDEIERDMRRRASVYAGTAGILTATAIAFFAPHDHIDVRPQGSYGIAEFKDLSVLQQRYIQDSYEHIWLPAQPKAEQNRLVFEAATKGQSVTALLWQQYGATLLDKCDNITQQSAEPPTKSVGEPGSSYIL